MQQYLKVVIVVPVVVLKNPQIPESLEYGEGQVRVVVRVKFLILRRGEGGEGKFFMIKPLYPSRLSALRTDK